VVGGQLGAAVPVSSFRDTADDGGSAEIFGGYRFDLAERVAVSLLGSPTFSFFGTKDCDASSPITCDDSEDVTSLVQLMAGPRLSLADSDFELYFDARGGYVAQMSGGLDDDDGGGFALGGGANYEFIRGTAAGVFFRYNEAFMEGRNKDATSGSGANLKFLSAGVGIQHRFLPPAVVVAEAPPPPAPPPPPPPKKKIVLRGVNFDFDKADIRPDARPVLDQAIATLKEAGDVRVAVGGHTDGRGTDEYNQGLSVRRAKAVADYMVAGGIARERLQVEGFGEAQPVASNDTDDGRAQNRRVELNILNGAH
jgi:outer membrane protein OmpA-like peptidoglycan-associated protein